MISLAVPKFELYRSTAEGRRKTVALFMTADAFSTYGLRRPERDCRPPWHPPGLQIIKMDAGIKIAFYR